MKRSEKAALRGSLAVGALLLASTVLYVTGWAATVRNIVVVPWRAAPLVELGKQEHFSPRPDVAVAEDRLKAYILVCGRIRPFGDRIDQWEVEHPGDGRAGQRTFKGGAAGLVGDYLRELNAALQDQRMGPAEYAWIGDRMRQAAGVGSASGAAADADRLLYGKYRDRLDASALGPHAVRIARDFAR
jgi:hypothetical protein